jgi:hypothetical protein
MAAKTKDFDMLLQSSVDEALLSLGEKARQSIYAYLEKNYHLTQGKIPQNLDTFQQALERVFGIGAGLIEILIMKNLCAKIGCRLNSETNKQLEFVKYVETARRTFTKESSNGNC